MPIYEYACEKCGKQIEVLHKVSERGPARCGDCGGKMTRLMSRSSFQLKGGGWYKDLYASTPQKKGASESSSSTPSSAKSESKPAEKKAAK